MHRRGQLWILIAIALVLLSSAAQAGPFNRRAERAGDTYVAPSIRSRPPVNNSRASAMYPKYYGGLHSRELSNIGIPNGDIGLRGNGVTAMPW